MAGVRGSEGAMGHNVGASCRRARARVRGAEGPMGEEVRGRCSAMGTSGEEGEACGGEGPRRGDIDGGDVVHSRGGGGGGRIGGATATHDDSEYWKFEQLFSRLTPLRAPQ